MSPQWILQKGISTHLSVNIFVIIRIFHVLSHLPLPVIFLPLECVIALDYLIISFNVFNRQHFERCLGEISLFRHCNEFIQDIIKFIFIAITRLASYLRV